MTRKRLEPVSVIGFDLSLTAPAYCFIPRGWRIGNWEELRAGTCLVADAPKDIAPIHLLEWRYKRIAQIRDWARLTVGGMPGPQRGLHLFVEDYAYGAGSSSVTRLAELGGVARIACMEMGHILRPLSASTARKLILGKVPRQDQKLKTHEAVWKYGAKDTLTDGDQVDAFAIANAGLAELGQPFLSLA